MSGFKMLLVFAAVVALAYKLFGPFAVTPYEVLGVLVVVPFLTAAIYRLMGTL